MQYFGKKPVKDFKGLDTTKAAIEASKKAAVKANAKAATSGKGAANHGGGRTRFIILSEKAVKIVKRDGKVRFPGLDFFYFL